MIEITNPNTLKDALHNLHPGNTRHDNLCYGLTRGQLYARATLVGVVSAFMAQGLEFDKAKTLALSYAGEIDQNALPESWRGDSK